MFLSKLSGVTGRLFGGRQRKLSRRQHPWRDLFEWMELQEELNRAYWSHIRALELKLSSAPTPGTAGQHSELPAANQGSTQEPSERGASA